LTVSKEIHQKVHIYTQTQGVTVAEWVYLTHDINPFKSPMAKPKVFITRPLPTSLDALRAIADVEIWQESESPSYELLQEKVQQIDGLVCLLTDRIDQALIHQAPFLKVISQVAV